MTGAGSVMPTQTDVEKLRSHQYLETLTRKMDEQQASRTEEESVNQFHQMMSSHQSAMSTSPHFSSSTSPTLPVISTVHPSDGLPADNGSPHSPGSTATSGSTADLVNRYSQMMAQKVKHHSAILASASLSRRCILHVLTFFLPFAPLPTPFDRSTGQ